MKNNLILMRGQTGGGCMLENIIGALISLAGGALISFVNYKITASIMKKKPEVIAASAVIRQIINVAYLVLVYFAAPHTPASVVYLLVGAVVGLTVPMFCFTYRLVKKSDKNMSDGGEK